MFITVAVEVENLGVIEELDDGPVSVSLKSMVRFDRILKVGI